MKNKIILFVMGIIVGWLTIGSLFAYNAVMQNDVNRVILLLEKIENNTRD